MCINLGEGNGKSTWKKFPQENYNGEGKRQRSESLEEEDTFNRLIILTYHLEKLNDDIHLTFE